MSTTVIIILLIIDTLVLAGLITILWMQRKDPW